MLYANVSQPCKRLYKVGKPYWASERKWEALAHLVAVLLLLFLNAAVAVFINKTASNFMTAIEQKATVDFYWYLFFYAGAMFVQTPVQVAYNYLRTRLALQWRQWLSSQLIARYFSNQAYYKLLNDPDLDNPDQRMTQDVDSFCNTSVGLFISVLDACVNVVSFTAVLWVLSPLLTYTVIFYAAAGTAAVVYIGKRLASLHFLQMKTEADLRFTLSEARREAQAIATAGSEAAVVEESQKRLDGVIGTLSEIMKVWRNVQLFTHPYNALVGLIPAALIAPLYFDGSIRFGDITQATLAFGVIFSGASVMISQFGGITNYAAIINRLGAFIEALEKADSEQPPISSNGKPGDNIVSFETTRPERKIVNN